MNIKKAMREIYIGENCGTVYIINNAANCAIVQGNNNAAMTKEEMEILRIYNSLNAERRHKFLSFALEIETENGVNQGGAIIETKTNTGRD
ncbi:MAG: hypothetical protein LBU26_01335 [Synergistaceae bacterium]|nr:hypothetical protein [Synergistaceae bacterium]